MKDQDNKKEMMNNSKGIKESYDYYKSKVKTPISSSDYRKLINNFNTFTMGRILGGEEVILPSRMGRICVIGVKRNIQFDEKGNIKNGRIDWKLTKEMWEKDPELKAKKELFYFFNEHSDGISYLFKWYKSRILVTNKNYYSFIPSRHNKRLLAKLIKSGQEYLIK